MVAHVVPPGSRLSPGTQRCPQCGQERARAELVRKGQRLARCNACYRAARRAGRQCWEQHNRERRTRLRHGGGVPCPPYAAWDVAVLRHGEDEPWTCALYGPRGRAWPEALVTCGPLIARAPLASRLVGACSCGAAGCVHLVVACLAQQGGGARDG